MPFVRLDPHAYKSADTPRIGVRITKGKPRVVMSIPPALLTDRGFDPDGRVVVSYGTGADAGRLLIEVAASDERGPVAVIRNGKSGDRGARLIQFSVPPNLSPARHAPVAAPLRGDGPQMGRIEVEVPDVMRARAAPDRDPALVGTDRDPALRRDPTPANEDAIRAVDGRGGLPDPAMRATAAPAAPTSVAVPLEGAANARDRKAPVQPPEPAKAAAPPPAPAAKPPGKEQIEAAKKALKAKGKLVMALPDGGFMIGTEEVDAAELVRRAIAADAA
jgi:hypothetical protein